MSDHLIDDLELDAGGEPRVLYEIRREPGRAARRRSPWATHLIGSVHARSEKRALEAWARLNARKSWIVVALEWQGYHARWVSMSDRWRVDDGRDNAQRFWRLRMRYKLDGHETTFFAVRASR